MSHAPFISTHTQLILPAVDSDGSSLLIRSFITPAPDLEIALAVCTFGPRIISLRLQLARLSCLTSRDDLCQSPDLIFHELSRTLVISWSGPDWSSYTSSKFNRFAEIHSRLQAPPPLHLGRYRSPTLSSLAPPRPPSSSPAPLSFMCLAATSIGWS